MSLQTVVLQYQALEVQIKPLEDPNQAPGVTKRVFKACRPIKNTMLDGSKSSPRNPNQALEVQIESQGSKSSPGGPNQAPGGPNQALGHKTGLQGCRPIKNTILDGSLEQVRFWGIWGELS